MQASFIRYCHAFGNYKNFADHTGFVVQTRWMRMLLKKFKRIESLHADAKANFDLTLLSQIESGKYKIRA